MSSRFLSPREDIFRFQVSPIIYLLAAVLSAFRAQRKCKAANYFAKPHISFLEPRARRRFHAATFRHEISPHDAPYSKTASLLYRDIEAHYYIGGVSHNYRNNIHYLFTLLHFFTQVASFASLACFWRDTVRACFRKRSCLLRRVDFAPPISGRLPSSSAKRC